MKNRGLIMNNDIFVKKFKYVMNQMFPNTNQNFTFSNFDKCIYKPELCGTGLYVIKPKKGYKIELVSDIDYPEGPDTYKNNPLKNFKSFNTIQKFEYKLNNSDNEFKYIGATPYDNSLYDRLNLYKKFGDASGNTNIRHSGGKRIWFIKNNKNCLVIDYINISTLQRKFSVIYNEAENIKRKYPHKDNLTGYIEDGLLYLHEFAYGIYPFANERCDHEETKEEWLDFWTNYKIN